MELIISVAYMALASVVCVRLYLYAHSMSTDSSARTHAITQAQNMIVSFQSSDGTLADAADLYHEVAEEYPGALRQIKDIASSENAGNVSSLRFDYDKDWYLIAVHDISGRSDLSSGSFTSESVSGSGAVGEPVSSDPAYSMIVSLSDSTDTPGMQLLTIQVQNEQNPSSEAVYATECRNYSPEQYSAYLDGNAAGKEAAP